MKVQELLKEDDDHLDKMMAKLPPNGKIPKLYKTELFRPVGSGKVPPLSELNWGEAVEEDGDIDEDFWKAADYVAAHALGAKDLSEVLVFSTEGGVGNPDYKHDVFQNFESDLSESTDDVSVMEAPYLDLGMKDINGADVLLVWVRDSYSTGPATYFALKKDFE